jgi:hypothetical protein
MQATSFSTSQHLSRGPDLHQITFANQFQISNCHVHISKMPIGRYFMPLDAIKKQFLFNLGIKHQCLIDVMQVADYYTSGKCAWNTY